MSHNWAGRRILAFMATAAVANMTTVVFHHNQDPRYPEYLYSFVSSSEENLCLMWLSLMHQLIHSTFSWIILTMTALLIATFAQSMISCLEILMDSQDSATCRGNIYAHLKWRLESYGRLQKLMSNFNSLFRWPMFFQTALIIGHMCIFIYIPLNYWDHIGKTSALMSALDAVFVLFGITFNLHRAMGVVHSKSKLFQPTFYKLLADALVFAGDVNTNPKSILELNNGVTTVSLGQGLTSNLHEVAGFGQDFKTNIMWLKLRAASCIPFGFEGGIFFTVTTSIFLTMFYAVTTHIIIMLQLDI